MSNPVTSAMLELAQIKRRDAERKGGRLSGAYTLILFALVIAALMVALLFGTTVYGAINSSRVADDESRAALNIIANAVRQSDASDAVKAGKGPEGRSLVFVEQTKSGEYETRFYLYEGELLQEYSRADSMYKPENAVSIAKTEEFKFKYDGSEVTATTDQGSVSVALRSSLSLAPSSQGEEDADA